MQNLKKLLYVLLFLKTDFCFASSGPGVKFIDFYEIIGEKLGLLDEASLEILRPVLGSIVAICLLLVVGIIFKKNIEKCKDDITPKNVFNISTFIEVILDFVINLGKDVIGEESKRFLWILSSLFLFIFFSNLSGLVPGFPPPTENLNTNLAMALTVFVVYNVAGIKIHGWKYIKQFLGPVWWMAPLLFLIELMSHFARPISLSLRLFGNIYGDHLILSVFTGLAYVVVPSFLLFFGLFVATLQSFVFTLLTSIYISMAISHDH